MFALASAGNEEEARPSDHGVVAGAPGGAQHRRGAAARGQQRKRTTGWGANSRDLLSRPAASLLVSVGDARADRADQLVPDSLKPTAVPTAVRLVGAAQRTGAKADRHAGVDPAAYFARVARRVRADPDGYRVDAASRRTTGPGGFTVAGGLVEVSEIAQSTLDKVRSLSQALHPVTLEEAGLESTVDWYLPVVERQNGIVIHYTRRERRFRLKAARGYTYIVCCKRRSTTPPGTRAQKKFGSDCDLSPTKSLNWMSRTTARGSSPTVRRGIGLVAMRERAELLKWQTAISAPAGGGTLVRLTVPKEVAEVGM